MTAADTKQTFNSSVRSDHEHTVIDTYYTCTYALPCLLWFDNVAVFVSGRGDPACKITAAKPLTS